MSKFIKVHLSYHELLTGKDEVIYIRADRIERLMNKTTGCSCLLKVEGTETPYGVDESVEEVLALIDEAEKKSNLYEKLKECKEKCRQQVEEEGRCSHCPAVMWCNDIFGTIPKDWQLDQVPEEYR